jgi:hypothetical protein
VLPDAPDGVMVTLMVAVWPGLMITGVTVVAGLIAASISLAGAGPDGGTDTSLTLDDFVDDTTAVIEARKYHGRMIT